MRSLAASGGLTLSLSALDISLLVIYFTFVIIAVTLVLQGLTLPALIRRLRVGADRSLREEQANARNAMSKAAMAAVDALANRESIAPDLAGRISAEFAEKNAADADTAMSEEQAAMARRLRGAAIDAERQELIRIWRDNQISDDVLHEFEEELDYKESHA